MRAIRYFALLCLLLPVAAFAGARDDLNAFTHGLKGLKGQFTQTVFDANGKLKERSSGSLALSAPRLFRWEYAKPYEQLVIADGSKVWVYDPDLAQVTVRAQGAEEQNSPLATLIDPARLDRDFNVVESGAQDGLDWLELTPKQDEDASFQRARLGFDANGLAKMEVVDMLGQRTEIGFSGWKKNPAFARDTFRYTPGKGVDVVDAG
ncbi:outer membrane lipoprotein chaperone LolA [Luteimonas mephitis]|uniref:outer membrane lipoprotein chaperone LolA n=1 Tax=Luteimonas mephitis TaxID=83615 RepID=UPI003A8D2C64